MSDERLQVALLLLDASIELHVMDIFPKYSPLIPVRTKNPQEPWDASCSSWIGVFGPPMSSWLDGGGEWKNEFRTELRPGRRIKL